VALLKERNWVQVASFALTAPYNSSTLLGSLLISSDLMTLFRTSCVEPHITTEQRLLDTTDTPPDLARNGEQREGVEEVVG